MKLASTVVAATCCGALLTVSARAETCDQRYPGSCRIEVSTTVVRTKGDAAVPVPNTFRRTKRVRKPLVKRVRRVAVAVVAPVVAVPLPRPSPRPLPAAASTKPTTLVDEAFNILTARDSTDHALEAALISRRNRMLNFALQ